MNRTPPRGQAGSATLELVVWGPVLLLILTAIIFAGRVAQARQTVEVAAGEAARAATVAGTRDQAQAGAHAAADAAFTSSGLKCTSVTVAVDTSQWALPPGQPARATARVGCRVILADLIGPGIPGSRMVQADASSALDTFRARP